MSIGMEPQQVPKTGQKKSKSSIIDCFKLLTSKNQTKCRQSANKLITHVHKCIENDNEGEVKSILDRLIRGLGSVARDGYYPIFVALLDTVPGVKIENVIESIKTELDVSGVTLKSVKTDIYLGHILCGGAILHSKLFLELSTEHRKYFLELILNAKDQKRNLACVASAFIADLVEKIDKDQFFSIVWPVLRSSIKASWEDQNINDVYIVMAIQNKFPEAIKTPQMVACYGKAGIFSKSNSTPICNILFKLADTIALQNPAYGIIAGFICKSKMLSSFLASLDEQLSKVTRNKLFIASIILRNFLLKIESEQIPQVLINNFIKNLIKYYKDVASKTDKEFNDEFRNFFKTLIDSLKSDKVSSAIRVSVIKKFILYPGTLTFDTITSSRIVQNIIPGLDLQGVQLLSELLVSIILDKSKAVEDDDTERNWLSSEKNYALQLLSKLFSNTNARNDLNFRVKHMKIFMDLGFLQEETEISGFAKDLFFKSLDVGFSKMTHLHSLLEQLIEYLKPTILSKNLSTSLSDEDTKTLKKMLKLTAKKSDDKAIQFFHLFFRYMGLQCFKNKQLALNCINELFLCYERVGSKRNSSKRMSNGDDDLQWIEVVVDLFLNILSLNVSFFRGFIKSTFSGVCEYLTPLSIQQLLNVMDPTRGVNPLSNGDEDEVDDEDSEKEDNEDSGREADEDSEEEEDDSETEEDEFEENPTELDKLRQAVQLALQNDGDDTDSLDLDNMSESEGKRLDDALANAFKEFKPNKGAKKTESDRILTNFRLKVMDLIEVIFCHNPSMLCCLEIVKTLLHTLEFTSGKDDQAPLEKRIKNFLEKMKFNEKNFSSIEDVTLDELSILFKHITEKGEKSWSIYHALIGSVVHSSVFIIKCSQIISKSQDIKPADNPLIQTILEVTQECIDQRLLSNAFNILDRVFHLPWVGNLVIVKFLLNSFHTAKPVKQRLILDSLKIFYGNRRLQDECELYLQKAEKKFIKNLTTSLEQFCTDQNKDSILAKKDFTEKLLELLKRLILHPFKNQTIKWEKLAKALKQYITPLSKNFKTIFNSLCVFLDIKNYCFEPQKESKKLINGSFKKENGSKDDLEVETKVNVDTSGKQKKSKKRKSIEIENKSKAADEEIEEADTNNKKKKKKGSAKLEQMESEDANIAVSSKKKNKKQKISATENVEEIQEEVNTVIISKKRKQKGRKILNTSTANEEQLTSEISFDPNNKKRKQKTSQKKKAKKIKIH